jgi:Asp-tRNA(Asn)/Glu-tRNA(Gln) amidotransferase A subunit family amidase
MADHYIYRVSWSDEDWQFVATCTEFPSLSVLDEDRAQALFVWADPASTCGLPATAAPIDRSPTGLPIGVQIIGSYLEDRTTVAFAELLEGEFGGSYRLPGYAGS